MCVVCLLLFAGCSVVVVCGLVCVLFGMLGLLVGGWWLCDVCCLVFFASCVFVVCCLSVV